MRAAVEERTVVAGEALTTGMLEEDQVFSVLRVAVAVAVRQLRPVKVVEVPREVLELLPAGIQMQLVEETQAAREVSKGFL